MSDNTSSNKRLAKNSIFLSIRMVIVLIISLYTTRLILKELGVEDYGIYNVVCGFVSMFAFLNTSMSNGIQRFFNFELGKNGEVGANKVYCTAFLIQFIFVIIIVILTETLGLWYLHYKMVIPVSRFTAAEWIFQLSIINFLFVIMQAPYTAAVMAHERMDFFAIISVFDALLKLGVLLIIPLFSSDKLILYGFLVTLISVINFSFYYCYCKKNFAEIKLHKHLEPRLFKAMLGFSGWNLFGSFSGMMQEQGINLVINLFFGPIVNAARGVASQVNAGMIGFVTNLTIPVRPQVVQSYAKGDNRRMMNLTYSISKLSCCFLLMMAIPVSIEIDYVLHIWLGSNVPDHAAAFTVIILLSSLVSNLNAAISNVVHATGIMKNYQIWGSIVKICSVPLAFFVLKVYPQVELSLIIVMICRLLGHIIGLYIVRGLVNMSLRQYCIFVIIPIAIVMCLSLTITYPFHWFMQEGFVRFLCVFIVGVFSVIITLYYLALDKNERHLLHQLFSSLFNRIKKNKQNV